MDNPDQSPPPYSSPAVAAFRVPAPAPIARRIPNAPVLSDTAISAIKELIQEKVEEARSAMVEEYRNKLEEARSAMAEQFQDNLEEGLSTMAEECITPMQDQITEIIRGIESLRVDLTSVRLMVNGALRRVEILERDLASLKKDGKGVVVGVDAGVGIGGGGMSENWPFLDNDPLKKLKPKRPDDNNDRNIGEPVLGGIRAEPPRQNALATSHLPSGSSHLQPQAQQQDKCSHTRGSNVLLPGVPIPPRKPDHFTSNDNPFDTRAHRPPNEPQNQQEKRNNNNDNNNRGMQIQENNNQLPSLSPEQAQNLGDSIQALIQRMNNMESNWDRRRNWNESLQDREILGRQDREERTKISQQRMNIAIERLEEVFGEARPGNQAGGVANEGAN